MSYDLKPTASISVRNNSLYKYSAKTKGFSGDSFAAQLENAYKTDSNTYVNKIENCYPGTTVTVNSMTGSDVRRYYEEWKNQPINYSGFKHDIVVSAKVLEKMNKDPKYAEQMLMKIKKAATPEGFGNAILYEYKVIVRDDGEIETMACADFMNGKNNKAENDDEEKKKKREIIYSHQRIYDPQYLFLK